MLFGGWPAMMQGSRVRRSLEGECRVRQGVDGRGREVRGDRGSGDRDGGGGGEVRCRTSTSFLKVRKPLPCAKEEGVGIMALLNVGLDTTGLAAALQQWQERLAAGQLQRARVNARPL